MRTIHLVSHTHWDREWYLTFQQFRLRLVRLVDNLLDILDAEERYLHFMLDGQTIVLEDYLALRPEREDDLRRYIKEGRILIGPWYILPDEFLVSPEATVRNLLEGDRTAKQFGPKMLVGYIPDPFGHIGQMPQILHGFGIQTASVMRGLADEPCEFWWQAPDGSKVLMAYLRNGYGNAADILRGGTEGFVNEAEMLCQSLEEHTTSSHFLLMHGTDHMEPHTDTCAALTFAEGRLSESKLVHSTLPAYFTALKAALDLDRLPVVKGELRSSKRHPLLPGVLSTRVWIKQRNRECETLLEKWVEPFCVWSEGLDQQEQAARTKRLRSPKNITRQAWRLLMQCHPHDSICGCSIDQVHDEMRPRFDQVEQIGEEITRQSLEALAEGINTVPGSGADGVADAIIVFNPASGPRTGLVSALLGGLYKKGNYELIDEEGAPLPFQKVGMGSANLASVVMNRNELRETLKTVADGIVMNWKTRDFQFRCEGNEAFIELTLVEKGVVNQAAWERGKKAVEAALGNPSITSYHIRIQSAEVNQLIFTAPDVPGYGYRTFWARSKAVEESGPGRLSPFTRALLPLARLLAANPAVQRLVQRLITSAASKTPDVIENEFIRVEASADGTIQVLDKTSGTLYQGQNKLVDGGDRGDEYNYSPPSRDQVVTARRRSVHVEKGMVQQTMEIRLELAVAEELAPNRKTRVAKKVILPVTSRVTLTQGVPRVDIHTEVTNLACDHRLRVHFPAPFSASEGQYDGHYEVVRRPVGAPAYDEQWIEQPRPETCQRAFTAIDDGKNGLLIANRGLPEVEVLQKADGNTEIAITLLRCVGWLSRDDFPERKGHAGPGIATPGAQMPGTWKFDYAIVPFRQEQTLAAYQQAYAFEAPMRAVAASLHHGAWPVKGSFLDITPEAFILSAVKASDDGKGWVARGYNMSDQPIPVTVHTIIPYQHAERVNLLEQVQEEIHTRDHHSVNLLVKGHEIVTIKFR